MNYFGQKNELAVGYSFRKTPWELEGIEKETWGTFELWVKDKNVCEYKKVHSLLNYEWNLNHLIEWIVENFKYITNNHKFPVPVDGNNSLELIQQARQFDSDDEGEIEEWFSRLQDWEFKHSWFSSRDGSYLPEVFFRRVENTIEISWDNILTYHTDGIRFSNSRGIEHIEVDTFIKVIKSFLEDYFKNLLNISKYKEEVQLSYHLFLREF